MTHLEVENVTIHVVNLGWKLEFTDGLRISDVHGAGGTMGVGGLTLAGKAIQLEIPPFASSPTKGQPTTVAATLTFTPDLSPTVLQIIPLEIALHFLDGKPTTTEIAAFASKAKARSVPDSDGLWSSAPKSLTIDDFLTGWFPGRDLDIDATYDYESGKWIFLQSGSFTLGTARFTLDPFKNIPTDTLQAEAKIGTTRIQLAIYFADGFAAPTLTFTSSPPLSNSEIHSLLHLPAPSLEGTAPSVPQPVIPSRQN